MIYLWAFLIGGTLCGIGQILIDKTTLTPAKILVIYVVAGAILGALGLYAPLAEFAGAGATVPITGFGYTLAKGAVAAVEERGVVGAFTGGLTATSAGLAASIFFGYIIALIFKPQAK